MDERTYEWYRSFYGLDREQVDRHLCIAEKVRGGYSLVAACRACDLDCDVIAERWGGCIERFLRGYPKHRIVMSEGGRILWQQVVPTLYIDALDRCGKVEEGKGIWPWLLLGALIGLGIVMGGKRGAK